MTSNSEDYLSWIGRSETLADTIYPTPVIALTATLDHPPVDEVMGMTLPPLWHWLYFLPKHRQSEIGDDGHAKRGGFLPPIPLPRRMWAGSQFEFTAPIRVGDRVVRTSTIDNVSSKEGRTGQLVFVRVRHEVRANDAPEPSLLEFHDIVYRAAQGPNDVVPPPQAASTEALWRREIVPDDVLLFRYSALTFNGHRIHYDRRYVTEVEGYPGLIVHGPLIATLLMDLLRRQMPDADVASFRFKAVRPTFDLDPFHVRGQPQADGKTIRLWASDHEGWLTMDATAVLRFDSTPSSDTTMASTIIDSRIFGDMFSDARMRDVWSDENRTAKYLDIERALAKVQGALGIIPAEAAEEIVRNCELSQIDWAKLKAKTEQIGYPIIAVVTQINANCRDKLGEYCHWGATTQDITDTAAVLQMREGLALVEQDLDEIAEALAALARKHRDTPVIGRSNLQQATPITFGYKMASILAGIDRHRERLQQLKPRVLMGEFGGASGTLSSLEKGAMETQAGLMKELGLAQPLISWHTVRDTIAEVGAFLGLVGGSLGKIAMDVKLMMQTEVAEVFEPFAPGRGSSSTMPQKRNPISCLYIHANISVARQHVAALMDAMVADHERSTGPWEIEWVSLPEIFCLMSGALKQTKFVLKGLEVDAVRMRRNIDITNGLVMSEAVMMGLGRYIGREYAHDLVYDLCREALKQDRPLVEILAAHPEINKHVTRVQLDQMCDPANSLGQAGVMVDRVLAARS